jgi:hypothetical protein
MPKAVPTVLTLSLLLGGTQSLQAADAPASPAPDAMTRLFAKLEAVMLGNPDPKTGPAGQIIMAVPGFPIPDAGLDSTNPGDMVFLNNTLDAIPGKSLYYVDSGKTYSGVYADILNNSMVPAANYTAADLAQMDILKKDLDPAGEKMKAYTLHQAAYNAAVSLLNSFTYPLDPKQKVTTSLPNPDGSAGEPKDYSRAEAVAILSRARNDWNNFGFKNLIETDENNLNTYNNRGSGQWWNSLTTLMSTHMADTNSPVVITYPKPENWGSNCTWTKFTFSKSDQVKSSSANSKSVEAAASYSGGGFNLSASGAWSKENQSAFAGDASTSIEVELARVVVYRPWMDTNVFHSKAWDYQGTLLSDNNTSVVSDGGDLLHNTGIMPLIIDQVWLARNLKVHGHWATLAADAMKQNINANLAVSYGPFALTGSYSQSDESHNWSSHAIDDGIEADGIQAIAFLCSVVPPCPSFVKSTDPSAPPMTGPETKVTATKPDYKNTK